MVNSPMLSQPLSTASRIWRSVTPLQRQTYTGAYRWLELAPFQQG
jgi:hypothetical protein